VADRLALNLLQKRGLVLVTSKKFIFFT